MMDLLSFLTGIAAGFSLGVNPVVRKWVIRHLWPPRRRTRST